MFLLLWNVFTCIFHIVFHGTMTDMFVPPIRIVINIIKSCKFIEVSPPLYVRELDPKVKL